jgi:cytochrome c-type biogenesis protein CcmH
VTHSVARSRTGRRPAGAVAARARRLAAVAAVWLLALAVAAGVDRVALAASVSDEDVQAIASQLRCVVCQNLSVADSPSEMAHQMRALIRERLTAGDKPAEVMAYFVQRYGDWVLLSPPPRGLNLILWFAPFAAVAGGLALVLTLVRRWRQASVAQAPAAAAPVVGPAERERLAAEIERLGD